MLDETSWNYELGDGCPNLCGWGNNELQVYTDLPKNVKLEESNLIITAIEEGNDEFFSARITTKDKVEFAYGRIDVRAKMPKGQGIWPAIWMLGANIDQVSWPACGEIDIMELVGHEPEKVHGTVHYENNGYQTTSGSKTLLEGDFSDEFHVYTLTWEQNTMSWYVDNELYKTFIKPANSIYPFNNEFFFILNIAVGGNWPGNPDATTLFPQEMTVDYIRVFR
jgi:beta-glucanase (GH16 family)